MENNFVRELIEKLEEIYKGHGIPVKRIPAQESASDALQMLFVISKSDDQPNIGFTLALEAIPIDLEDAEIIQIYVYIRAGLSDDETAKLRTLLDIDSLMRAYGSYGLFPSGEDGSRMLFFKQEILLLHEDGVDHAAKQFERTLDYLFVMLKESIFGVLEEIGVFPEDLSDSEDEVEEPNGQEASGSGQAEQSEQPASAFCRECGSPIRPGAKFCLNCGTPV